MDKRQCPALRELLLQLEHALNDIDNDELFKKIYSLVDEYEKQTRMGVNF